MPLVRIDFAGIPDAKRRHAIADSVHDALAETMNVPYADRFQILGNAEAIYDRTFPNLERSEEWVVIQVALRAGRTQEMKKNFYRRVVERLAENPGLRADDVMISLIENSEDDWSFGRGEAQYAKPKAA